MAQRKPTPEEGLRKRRERVRDAMRRTALRRDGKLPPPDEDGIKRWWRERGY